VPIEKVSLLHTRLVILDILTYLSSGNERQHSDAHTYTAHALHVGAVCSSPKLSCLLTLSSDYGILKIVISVRRLVYNGLQC
jgi:hypothetical protein